jgi:UDP-N-acetylmuramate--alanine ligase
VGGRIKTFEGHNAKLGKGDFVVAEADESDGSFLHLSATYGIITNIDSDHLDHFLTIERLREAFVNFVGKMPFFGVTAVCIDDPGVKTCFSQFTKPVLTYGFSDEAEVRAIEVKLTEAGSRFYVSRRNPGLAGSTILGEVELPIPGKHNVLNALGALTLCDRMGLPFSKIQEALKSFQGVKRRFDVRFRGQNHAVVDDYGHHPSEIRATIQAAKQFWPGRIVTVFQPHRYSRTALCFEEFKSAFADSDVTLIADIYAAGEQPIAGISSADLAKAVQGKKVSYSGDLDATLSATLSTLAPGDLVLCMGAGSITSLPDRIIGAGTLS